MSIPACCGNLRRVSMNATLLRVTAQLALASQEARP